MVILKTIIIISEALLLASQYENYWHEKFFIKEDITNKQKTKQLAKWDNI